MNIHSLLSFILPIIGIPLAVLLGFNTQSGNGFYITALIVVIISLLSFILGFEGKKPKTSEIVTVSVLAALAVCGRAAFYMLPQFKPMLAIVVITGICFGKSAGRLTGTLAAFVSNFLFGQGPLTPWQMLGFGLCGFLSGAFLCGNGELRVKLRKNKYFVAFFGGFLSFVPYGLIINPASAMILYRSSTTLGEIIASYISGFSFDIIHFFSTVIFLIVLYKPVIRKLERIKIKYGMY